MSRISRKEVREWIKAVKKAEGLVTLSKPDRNFHLTITTWHGYANVHYEGNLSGVLAVLKAWYYGYMTGEYNGARGTRRI